jgi:predicted secreted protein
VTITTGLAIYFVIWWLVLFTVLPWGVRSQQEHGEVARGTDPGAPSIPHLGRKLLWTTGVTAAIFAAIYVVHINRWVTLDDLATLFGLLR